MKVLVTGGCGFIGSHVCEYYRNKGIEVVSVDNMTKYELSRTGYIAEEARNHNWNFLKRLGVNLYKEDIRNLNKLMEITQHCDFIIHTAAQPAMTISLEDPELDISTNVIGTFNVLELARKFKIPVVYCGTIHIYGNKINETLRGKDTRYVRRPIGIDESHPVVEGLLTPLHASKRSAELYVQTYIDSYGVEAASFRLTGLYGPRQFGGEDHGWVANFAIRAVAGLPINIYGTGKQVRDILYATDVCEAFDTFYRTRKPGIYNIGGGEGTAISLIECVRLIENILEKKLKVNFAPARKGDLKYFICDINKAKKFLKWEPQVKPRQGIKHLIEWIKDNENIFVFQNNKSKWRPENGSLNFSRWQRVTSK
ncbi:MAG: NAD-dependent epimerase/dehydratase family protein [bacterium]